MMRERRQSSGFALAVALCFAARALAAPDANVTKLTEADRFFLNEVKPLLALRCIS